MKILILGDVHGEWVFASKAIQKAMRKHDGITHIIQVGDLCEFWPKKRRGYSKWNPVTNGLKVHWLDGNHDNHDILADYDKHPHNPLLVYQPRGSVLEIEGYRMMFMGGASSIDKDYRQAQMSIGKSKCWWDQENIKHSDFERAMANTGPFDAIFSHDRPDCFPHKFIGHNDDKSRIGLADRIALEGIYDKFLPKFWFFGHYHYPDTGIYRNTEWTVCPAIGPIEPNWYPYHYCIWDGKTVWRSWQENKV